MIPKIFHITLPQDASERRDALTASIRRLHPDWDIKVWQDPLRPEDFLLGKYFSKCNAGAQLADLVRIDVLFRFGGVYLDSDVEILRSFDQLVEQNSFFIGTEDGFVLTHAIFGGEKGHPALQSLMTNLLEHEPDWSIPCDLTTGPRFYARVIGARKDITILPRATFYPYSHDEAKTNPHRLSYAVHHWDGSRVRKGQGEQKSAPPLAALKECTRRLIKLGVRMAEKIQRVGSGGAEPHRTAQKFYSCSPEVMLETPRGIRMFVNGLDTSVTPELILTGTYEPSEERFVARTLRGGDTFVDVGANVGVFTLLAAQRVGRFGKVVAFEPNETVANLLAKSLIANWWQERVELRRSAVADFYGPGTLLWSREVLGGARLESEEGSSATASKIDQLLNANQQLAVKVVRLDDQFPANLPVTILKIDVEGHEGAVLRGAARLLVNKSIDFIILEAISDVPGENKWRDTLNEVKKALDMGYTLNKISPDGSLVPLDISKIELISRTRSVVLSANAS